MTGRIYSSLVIGPMQPSLLQYDGMAGPISLVYQISVFGSVVYNVILSFLAEHQNQYGASHCNIT